MKYQRDLAKTELILDYVLQYWNDEMFVLRDFLTLEEIYQVEEILSKAQERIKHEIDKTE